MGPLGVISASHGTINTCRDINPDLHNSFAPQTVKVISPFTSHFSRKNPPQPSLTKGGSKIAFTLAEVLITLGIIGVVAALTMPTLMAQHRKQVIETRLAKFYSVFNQAIEMAEAEHGSILYWGELQTEKIEGTGISKVNNALEWYNKYLAKYLNTTKVEAPENIEGYIVLYFADGSLAFGGNTWNFYPNAKDFVLQEKDGMIDKDKTLNGKKYFTFQRTNGCKDGRLIPFGTCYYNNTITDEIIRNDSTLGCREDASQERAFCTLLIAKNGWKIPKDYPLKL